MTPATRPNILFMVVDDCGYADLGCTGQTDYATPALDELASEGVRFTQAYANAPLCTNTRVALITGRYQYRLPIGLVEPLRWSYLPRTLLLHHRGDGVARVHGPQQVHFRHKL